MFPFYPHPESFSITCKIEKTGTQAKFYDPKSVSLALLLFRKERVRKIKPWIWMYLIMVAQIQKPFLLLAPFSLLRSSYCYSDLLGPSLWSRFFSWASAWNFDLALWPLGESLLPLVHSCFSHVRKLSTQSTELLSSRLPRTFTSRPCTLTSGIHIPTE